MKRKKVMVATPIHRQPHPRMDASRKAVIGTSQRAECSVVELRNESLISRARNTLVSTFMASKCEYLYFWDDDIEAQNIGGPAGNLLDMLLSHDKPFTGGLYATRGFDGHCAGRVPLEWNPDKRLVQVQYLAGGSMMFHRSVVQAIIDEDTGLEYGPLENEGAADRSWAIFQPFIHNGEYLSEDFAFCERWARCPGERPAVGVIWADLDVQLFHWGEAPFALIDPRKAVSPQ